MKLFLLTSRNFPLLLLPFLFAGSLPAKPIDRSVAIVNNEVILDSDIEKFQTRLKSKNYQELFGAVDDRALKSKEAALSALIEEKLINQQVKKLELSASEQEVDGQIRAIAKRNGINEGQLLERLKQLGASIADYKEGIRKQLERRNLIDREIRPNLEVSEEQLRRFYLRNAHADDAELQYKIAHILISNKTKGKVTPLERATAVYKELSEHPEKFEEFAKDVSDDGGTSQAGGVLGYFSLSQLNKEFRNAVPKVKVGGITTPIRTSAGYHIVKLVETRSGGDFAGLPKERREALKNQIIGEELEKRMVLWLERKKAESFIKVTLNPKKAANHATQ